MTNSSNRFFTLILFQAGSIFSMEYQTTGNQQAIEYMPEMYMASRNPEKRNYQEITSSDNKIDFTGKLSGNKNLNKQLRSIIRDEQIEQAYIAITQLEAISMSSTRIISSKDTTWITNWLEKLYDIVRQSGGRTNSNISSDLQEVIVHKSEIAVEKESVTTKFHEAVLVEVTKEINPKQFDTEEDNDNSPAIEIELTPEELQTFETQPEIKAFEPFEPEEDLTRSIKYVQELDQQTKETYNKISEAKKALKSTNETKRLEEAKNLVKSLENLDSQKEAAMKTLEQEIEKLETKAKDNKALEPQVAELKETLNTLKAGQNAGKEKLKEAKRNCTIV